MCFYSESKKFKIKQIKKCNNDSPTFVSKKVGKNNFGILQVSEASTLNTISNSLTNNIYKENTQINSDEKVNHNSPEILAVKLYNAFDALEKLLINDINNEINKTSKNKKQKKNKSISIPKLNFSDIFDYYNNTPIQIKEINKGNPKHKNFQIGYNNIPIRNIVGAQ